MTDDFDVQLLNPSNGNAKLSAFVQIAVLIAITADGLHEVLRWLIGRSTLPDSPLPPPPPLQEWLPMYRQHRRIYDELFTFVHPDIAIEYSANELRNSLQKIPKLTAEELREELKSATEAELETIARPFTRQSLPSDPNKLQAYIDSFDEEENMSEEDLDNLLNSTVGQFFFRVWLPCWIMHRDVPANLLRKARMGNDKSLDQILRLDKSVIHDPVIAKRFHQAMHGGTQRERDLIMNALAGKPKGKLDKRILKYGLSGMISQLAKESQTSITAPEITKLFDTVAQLQSRELRDNNIPAGEVFTRAISRNNKDWPMNQLH